MKKLFLILLVSLLLTSCFGPYWDDPKSIDKVIILDIKYDGSSNICWYRLGVKKESKSLEEQGSFWLRDSIGKYKINDTLNE